MHDSYLHILNFLGNSGYYVRTHEEKEIFQEFHDKGFVNLKKGTKCIYLLTEDGKGYLDRERNPNTSMDDKEFLTILKETYQDLATPMKPLVKIPDIRKRFQSERIPDQVFDEKILEFHDRGIITLQTALSKSFAGNGGIESDSGTGVFYFMMFEA
ncbi:MAG: hypothetical protein EAX86_05595 [Candidatus Heimdallarchaeota archaeon]|nr:hypothetical protein [Candidatus Heimdallarchaeota archaeon]